MNIEEQIINDAGKAIAKEIDFEILCSMLQELGWRKIVLRPMSWEYGYAVDQRQF